MFTINSRGLSRILDISKNSDPAVPSRACFKVNVNTPERSNFMENRNLSSIEIAQPVVAALELANSKKSWLKTDDMPELKCGKGGDTSVIDIFVELVDKEYFSKEDQVRCEVANINIDITIRNLVKYETKLGKINNWFELKKFLRKTIVSPLEIHEAYLELTQREYDVN